MSKITVIGSLNMDLVVTTPKIPVMGETILGSGFMTAPGGKGANQAVAAARLGGNVSMVGCVGNDIFGMNLIDNLSENNVDVKNVQIVQNSSTGIAMIVVKDGDNFIIVDPGANSSLSSQAVQAVESLIQDSSIIVVQLEIPMEAVQMAVELAKRHGIKLLLNPAPGRKLSDELLSSVDILTPNESECEIITGLPIKNVEDAQKAIKMLQEKGIPNIIVTMGGNGVVYNNGNDIIHKPVPKVNVVDTTAAGDSFSGALAVALAKGDGMDEAIDFANTVGTLTVTKRGAQTSLPTLEDVHEFMKKR